MHALRPFIRSRAPIAVGIVLAVLVGLGLLVGVNALFQRDGAPYDRLVLAEHACTDRLYVSEKETCMRAYLETARDRFVATR